MAKAGEGDPRWIVEERADGTNVNNWHWTEKNALAWTKARLGDLLVNLSVEDASGNARTTEVASITGEASASNRKGKIILFYELEVSLKWKGKTADGQSVAGTVSLDGLSEENDPDEVELSVKMTSDSTAERNKVRILVRKALTPLVHEQLEKWLQEFKGEYTKGMVLDTELTPQQAMRRQSSGTGAQTHSGVRIHTEKPAVSPSGVGSFEITDTFDCRPQDLFQALLDPDRVRAYTQADARIDAKVGGGFSLFNGQVTGTIKALSPYSSIVQAWRFKDWTEGHYSEVTMAISETKSGCRLVLRQTGVPTGDIERTQDGWKRHHFDRMKGVLGFGMGVGGLVL